MVPTHVDQTERSRLVTVTRDVLMTSRFAGLASSANFGVPGVMPPPLAPPSFSRVG